MDQRKKDAMERVAIISVDGHVKAPRAGYRDYIDPKWRAAFDDWVKRFEGTPDGFVRADFESGQWDPKRRVADLETQGVAAEVLFANGAPFAAGRVDYAPDPEQTRQANMAFNRWVIDFCSEAPGRLHGQALVSFDDVDQAVKDVYWAKEQGLVGILMPPLYPGSKFFFDPALDPIWAACQEVGLPLSQHGGTGAPDYQPQVFAAFMVLAAEHSFFSGRSLWQLILGGAFDRFPDLKIAFIETESWWIAPMMDLLDGRERAVDDWTEFAESMRQAKPYSRLPSEYWRTNCYAGISPFHPSQLASGDLTGNGSAEAGFRIHSDNAMFGVDYPHPESIYPNVIENARMLAAMPQVTEADVRKVLYENAAEVFHLDLAALQPQFDRVGFELEDLAATPA
jgi:predicted TIM-barrel fold metal-dependent hydrolase